MTEIKPLAVVHPRYSWVVNVPPKISGGKRVRKYFRTRKEADEECVAIQVATNRLGLAFFADITEDERAFMATQLQRHRKSKHTFGEIWAKFEAYQAPRASASYRSDMSYMGKVICEKWGDMLAIDLEGGAIREWIYSLTKKDGEPVGASTQHYYFRLMRAALNFAVASGWLTSNPCAAISQHIQKPDAPKGILTPKDLKKLIEKAAPAFRLWLALGAFGGLRPCEAMKLEWSHIHFDASEIYVPAAIVKQSKGQLTEGRVITLVDNLKEILQAEADKNGRIVKGSAPQLLKQKWAAEKAASVDIPHDALRHSFATYLFTIKKDMNQVAAQLGHTGTMVTMRHYARRDIPRADADQWFAIGLPKSEPALS